MSNQPSSSQADDADKPCERCGAPASWAGYMNLPWKASIQHHLVTFLASPRMWPVGYIIGSSYSPLQLELEMPGRNWRDAFEDLISLETGGRMISNESREKEAEVTVRLFRQDGNDAISQVNDKLERQSKQMSLLQRARKLATRANMSDKVSELDKEALQMKMRSQELIDVGQEIILRLQELEQADKLEQSSRGMKRGHWIASLFSRGALPGWQSKLLDSADGPYWYHSKNDGEGDGHSVTESELSLYFEGGHPLEYGSPDWSTASGGYPEVKQRYSVSPEDNSIVLTEFKLPPLPHSISIQAISPERTKLPNGLFSTKVKIWNRYTDGREEEKEIVDDTGKVLEEVKKAMVAMENRRHRITMALRDEEIKENDAQLKRMEIYVEDD